MVHYILVCKLCSGLLVILESLQIHVHVNLFTIILISTEFKEAVAFGKHKKLRDHCVVLQSNLEKFPKSHHKVYNSCILNFIQYVKQNGLVSIIHA